jgi:hypothetical protein
VSTLRIAVTPGAGIPGSEQADMLNDLMGRLKGALGLGQRLSRLPELTLPGAAPAAPAPGSSTRTMLDPDPPGELLRVFLLELQDGEPATAALHALSSWYMRHPRVTVTLKAEGPGGGVSLKLAGFSMVSFAAAAARVNEQLAEPMEPPRAEEKGGSP